MRSSSPVAVHGADRHRLALVMLAIAGACRPTGPASTTAPPAEPTATASDDAAFLDPAADIGASYPWKAKLARAATVRLEHDGDPMGDARNHSIDLPVIVVDDDAAGDPRRPRVLCEHSAHRIAVHYDADDLGFVAREGATMMATPGQHRELSERDPGVRLAAGTPLRTEGRTDGAFVRVVLESPMLRAAGFLDAEHCGLTYRPAPFERPAQMHDTRVKGATSLLATPAGPELVQLRDDMAIHNIGVRRLGTEQAGHALVEIAYDQMSAIGWIDAAQLASAGVTASIVTTRGIAMTGDVEGEPQIPLAVGTTLHGGGLRNRIGVVTAAADFHCVDACDGPEPVVEVAACTVAVRVVARAPR